MKRMKEILPRVLAGIYASGYPISKKEDVLRIIDKEPHLWREVQQETRKIAEKN